MLDHNAVPGCPGWFYGVRVTSEAAGRPAVTFDLEHPELGLEIKGLRASAYRTTELARSMGERALRGYEDEARDAIGSRAEKEQTDG